MRGKWYFTALLLRACTETSPARRFPPPGGHHLSTMGERGQALTRLCSISKQKSTALPTSRRFWKHTVFSSAYSTMSFSWWWKNSRMPVGESKRGGGSWRRSALASRDVYRRWGRHSIQSCAALTALCPGDGDHFLCNPTASERRQQQSLQCSCAAAAEADGNWAGSPHLAGPETNTPISRSRHHT